MCQLSQINTHGLPLPGYRGRSQVCAGVITDVSIVSHMVCPCQAKGAKPSVCGRHHGCVCCLRSTHMVCPCQAKGAELTLCGRDHRCVSCLRSTHMVCPCQAKGAELTLYGRDHGCVYCLTHGLPLPGYRGRSQVCAGVITDVSIVLD